MNLRRSVGVVPAFQHDGSPLAGRVSSLVWSPNCQRLAVGHACDREVILYNTEGQRKDKIPVPQGQTGYPRAMAFSPDSLQLAVASESVVTVYELGSEWGDPKRISRRFPGQASVTCVVWPLSRPNEIVYGTIEGKIRMGVMRANQTTPLYTVESAAVSLCVQTPSGPGVLSGHADGSLYMFNFDRARAGETLVAKHTCAPQALAWGLSIVAAGCDRRINFYDVEGDSLAMFSYDKDPSEKDFTIATFNPSGDSCVVASYNHFRVFGTKGPRRWEQTSLVSVTNYYTITALSWKADGSGLALGTTTGVVDIYEASMKRSAYKNKYEIVQVSNSAVLIKRLSTGKQILVKSQYGRDIVKTSMHKDRYYLATTADTLLVADCLEGILTEVRWSGSGSEKFVFDNPAVVMIVNAGELAFIEHGVNQLLGPCRTQHTTRTDLISVQISPGRKFLAHLVDAQTVRVVNLENNLAAATVTFDTAIDWLELNRRATKLVFRDKRHSLHLLDLATQTRTTLLSFCNYVQWVPQSDVCVAQSREQLFVWYSIDEPDRPTILPIKGEAVEIERGGGKTSVLVDEGGRDRSSLQLDDSLIEFGTAMDDGDLPRAMHLLDRLENSTSANSMWRRLGAVALEQGNLPIMERCFAAIGDIARARYVRRLQAKADDPTVAARVIMLAKRFGEAEMMLRDMGRRDEAMDMYSVLHKWDDSLRVARETRHPQLQEKLESYFNWLLETKQHEKAAEIKERDGDYVKAIKLYLLAGMPSKAANLVPAANNVHPDMLELIASTLFKAGMFERAGSFYEQISQPDKALNAYSKGKCFRPAVDLARRNFPDRVVDLESEWGDHLMAQKQPEAAAKHYIEAHKPEKAMEAAVSGRLWQAALQFLPSLDEKSAAPYYKPLAVHFDLVHEHALAEQFYVKAGMPQEAVTMYNSAQRYDDAHRVAMSYMNKEEANRFYLQQARAMDMQGKFREAERLYVAVHEVDVAIEMYHRVRQYDNMIRLIAAHHPDKLNQAHLHLGRTLEKEGNLKVAEKHYVASGEWKAAEAMYRQAQLWDDALRVSQLHGGNIAHQETIYHWATSMGGEAGAKLLAKHNMIESAIAYALSSGEYDQALELAEISCRDKLPEVYVTIGHKFATERLFKEAEDSFLRAGRPEEAIAVYLEDNNFDAAMRIAETHSPASVPDVQVAHALALFDSQEWTVGEALFLRAQKPGLCVDAYQRAGRTQDALRVAAKYCREKLPELQGGSANDILAQAKSLVELREYSKAIDAYLAVTEERCRDRDKLENAWVTACNLAMKHVPARREEVAGLVSGKMTALGHFEAAGDLLKSAQMLREAVETYIQGGLHVKAHALAVTMGPDYVQFVERHMKTSKIDASDWRSLLESGMLEEACDILAQREMWPELFKHASKEIIERKYALPYANILVGQGRMDEAAKLLVDYNISCAESPYLILCEHLTHEILKQNSPSHVTLGYLREILFTIVRLLGSTTDVASTFERLLLICHFLHLKEQCRKDLPDVACKLAISLLRYTTIIPVDSAFFEAGTLCREQKRHALACIFLDRVIDISKAVDGDAIDVAIDNHLFANTDIPNPEELHLPTRHLLSEHQREQITDYVLAQHMASTTVPTLPTMPCERCATDIYEFALLCFNCSKEYVPCIVTGAPILATRAISCTNCRRTANRDDWNRYVQRMNLCPWCLSVQTPKY
eukprot:gnl/Spiro4/24229_TR12030_c0_g1_i1.p1 gnl/Spiro4/24229_TR12030_c0_g1~~gnl/Spiro4/24229_TR12030_c0_g1_i1.p1  ORF type:complete len:1700 (+),score=346.14 gnl/Spiro4/24229_TR12030_c0_g1_i1:76-5175(+)